MSPRGRPTAHVPTGLGAWVRLKREAKGWTQTELAERAGLTQSQIADVEHGRWETLKLSTVEALCNALGAKLPWQERTKDHDRTT